MSRATPRLRLPLRDKNEVPPRDTTQGAPDKITDTFLLGTPPRKRAVPLEDVHARNAPDVVLSKRARTHAPTGARADSGYKRCHTTTRIDYGSRMTRDERAHREHHKAESQRQWKQSFGRAFPRFVFYLDHIDASLRRTLIAQITQLGARVDDFFSRSVTHVVTTRPLPLAQEENREPVPHEKPLIQSPRIVFGQPRQLPQHSDWNPLEDTVPSVPSNDLLYKAQRFEMKLWRLSKLQNILSVLLAEETPAEAARADLSQMLQQEKVHGTTERDPAALRSDYHYFGKNTYYVLVTDATGEHRPIIAAEYDRNAPETGKTPWPVLHGEIEGRGLFVPVDARERERAARAGPRNTYIASLRRAQRFDMACSSAGPPTPNLMASDNSIALASTVASTTSTNITSQAGNSSVVLPDKRVAELNRRMHTPLDVGVPRHDSPKGAVVRRMLGLMERRPSGRRGYAPRERRPGHCENCRCRFEDFDEHTRSRRHRRFALDESNFVQLDELINRVQRVPVDVSPSEWPDYAEYRDLGVSEAVAESGRGADELDGALGLTGQHDDDAALDLAPEPAADAEAAIPMQ